MSKKPRTTVQIVSAVILGLLALVMVVTAVAPY